MGVNHIKANRMFRFAVWVFGLIFSSFTSLMFGDNAIIVDHQSVQDFSVIPPFWIQEAKKTLHIAYQHTSHGSQLITGMYLFDKFMGQTGIFTYNNGGLDGALDLHDYAMDSYYQEGTASDLGYYPNWVIATRNYLNAPENQDVNVIVWSWCDLHAWEAAISGEYIPAMEQLEIDYPSVKFVYMTGHSNGSGEEGAVHIWNTVIRQYCIDNNKILYDFYDIELYDPDGVYYGNKLVNDNCDYDSDGDGARESNWATEWQNSYVLDADWYNCSCAHSQALNCNQKAKAAWYLWARIAGWDGCPAVRGDVTGDCRVDLDDFSVLVEAWLTTTDSPNWESYTDIAPVGGDGIVNTADFAVMSQAWYAYHCAVDYVSDLNGNCKVEIGDFVLLAESWLSVPGDDNWSNKYDLFPVGGDGQIDLQEFSVLAREWME